jgi:hypothetical protein
MRKIASEARARVGALRRFDGDALSAALLVLATDIASRPAREGAARILLEQLRALVGRAWVGSFSWSSAFRRSGDFAEALEDAIQHVAVVASTGKSRFRGRHPGEAVAWCRRILLNFLSSESRRLARTVGLLPSDGGFSSMALDQHLEGIVWRQAGQEAALFLGSLEARVWLHLQRTRTRRASQSLYRAVREYLYDVSGQLDKVPCFLLTRGEAPSTLAARRARDRGYQQHTRARRVLAEVLAMDAAEARAASAAAVQRGGPNKTRGG